MNITIDFTKPIQTGLFMIWKDNIPVGHVFIQNMKDPCNTHLVTITSPMNTRELLFVCEYVQSAIYNIA